MRKKSLMLVMSGLGGLKVKVHPEHEARLCAIEEEDYSGVIRKVRDIFTELTKV